MTLLLMLSIACLACTVGCSSTQQPAPAPQVDECGSYEVDVQLPENACTTDADCAWTEHRPGTCHGPYCEGHYSAGPKAWVEAVDAMHQRICAGAKYTQCNKYKCLHNKPTGVACQDGKCVLSF